MKTLTTEQAQTLFAFLEAHDLTTTGAWPAIETCMKDDFGIEDPETAIEDAKMVLQ